VKRSAVACQTRLGGGPVPRVVRLALGRVMHVVELTVFRHTQSLALKRSHCVRHIPTTSTLSTLVVVVVVVVVVVLAVVVVTSTTRRKPVLRERKLRQGSCSVAIW